MVAVPPTPTNIQLRRTSPTIIEVRWDDPDEPVAGYRIYYSIYATLDMDRWQSMETGPYTVAEISSLEPHSVYAVRVRAKGTDGRYGNYSELVYLNDLPSSKRMLMHSVLLAPQGSFLSSPDKPDMVEQFLARTNNPRSIMLEWKPPQKPGVMKYKVQSFSWQ